MNKFRKFLILLAIILPAVAQAQFEKVRDSVVQLYGVVMTSDSLDGIPNVSVTVKGSNRGTITNSTGVFSIAVLKGDMIEFSHVSFKQLNKQIPKVLNGTQFSLVVLMTQDTTFLPAVVIKPRPTKEQFARDFVNVRVAEDEMEILRKANTLEMQRAVARRIPYDGREVSNMQLNQIAIKARYQGQVPPQNIFNPAAWQEFIQAWKRGDFKRKY